MELIVLAAQPYAMRKKALRRTYIREWRKHRGLTLEQLAGRLNMTASHLSMLERRERPYTQDTLEAIAEALGTEPASLLMRDPAKGEDSLWLIWDRASESERRQIEAVAAALKRTGT